MNFLDPRGQDLIPAGNILTALGLYTSDSIDVTAGFEDVPYYSSLPGAEMGWSAPTHGPDGEGDDKVLHLPGGDCPQVPQNPGSGTLASNIVAAEVLNAALSADVASGAINATEANAIKTGWFAVEVHSGGAMDYKQQGSQYRAFGNFNFGAVGAALGFSTPYIQWGAGVASYNALLLYNIGQLIMQEASGGTNTAQLAFHLDWGTPLTGPPYGDNPQEQAEIAQGVQYFQALRAGKCQ